MPMREDCKHYQSRTYTGGEVARWCELDLAPDAPWRCPAGCPKYERRQGDAGWTIGTLAGKGTPKEPEFEGVAELLDQAEDIVNEVGPQVLAEWETKRGRDEDRSGVPFWRRLFRRR
ncbi:MAG TPA: hypothetical protein VFA94_06210, partial [Acidimicrobiales bacterium]|nr:hypothetical protein [Acidimicrobiales bacterium]